MGRGQSAVKRSLLRARLDDALDEFEQQGGELPGVARPESRAAFVGQLTESARRTAYFDQLLHRPGDLSVEDPRSEAFNPLAAAIRHERRGDRDEAFWLVFLFVHFGKHRRSGWRRIGDIYGRLGSAERWSWDAVAADVDSFRVWLDQNLELLSNLEPRRGFGNHRKYESLDAWSDNGTGAVVASYVEWVGSAGHDARIAEVTKDASTPARRFDAVYRSVRDVRRFGRTAAFDYAATLAKLRFLPIEPGAACIAGATGPRRGAQMLLEEPGKHLSPAELETKLVPLRESLGVGFDVLEDALCNWQKSPDDFKPFRG
jgi:hypothetical protein